MVRQLVVTGNKTLSYPVLEITSDISKNISLFWSDNTQQSFFHSNYLKNSIFCHFPKRIFPRIPHKKFQPIWYASFGDMTQKPRGGTLWGTEDKLWAIAQFRRRFICCRGSRIRCQCLIWPKMMIITCLELGLQALIMENHFSLALFNTASVSSLAEKACSFPEYVVTRFIACLPMR